MRHFISGNESAAWAARRAKVHYIPNFPITPQTQFIETIAEWVTNKEMKTYFDKMESEHSVMSAAIGGSSAGARVFTATSSQGLELMHEMLFIASGLRLPIVMANCSRALSAPITLWTEHTDFLNLRDTGWIMVHAQDNQEVFDSVLLGFKVGENNDVLLPTVVNMEGYVLSYTKEPVDIPAQTKVDSFLPAYNPKHAFIDGKEAMNMGMAVMETHYTGFKAQQQKAMSNALKIISKECKAFAEVFGRSYGLIEEYKCKDAEVILVCQGAMSTTVRAAIDAARKKGRNVGMLRLRVIRPFPKEEVKNALKDAAMVSVLDRNLSIGYGGIMFPEICSALYHEKKKPLVSDYIVGLGGRPQTIKKINSVIEKSFRDLKNKETRLEWNDLNE